MALQFNPPEWLIQEYMKRKQPAEIASEGIGTALNTYAQAKQQQQTQALAQEDRNLKKKSFDLQRQRFVADFGYDPENPGAAFDEFIKKYPQGIKGREKQQSTEPIPLYDQTGKPIGTVPHNAKVVNTSSGIPKPVPGYRYSADGQSLEAIPGGPAFTKEQEKASKEQGLRDAAINQANTVIGKVDQALGNVNKFTTGMGGSIMSKVPGTSAVNLRKDIDTIKANLGFATLQEMRRNSPTGGALGAIAVQELEMLQSTVSSLDTAQSDDQLIRNLGEVKKHYENWKKAVNQDGGGQPNPMAYEDPNEEAAYQAYKASQGGRP